MSVAPRHKTAAARATGRERAGAKTVLFCGGTTSGTFGHAFGHAFGGKCRPEGDVDGQRQHHGKRDGHDLSPGTQSQDTSSYKTTRVVC